MYRPRHGDILVSQKSARADRYSIGVVDDAEQEVAPGFDEAMRIATQLAGERKVDGWYTCDHTHFLLVAHHRSANQTAVDGLASEEGGRNVEGWQYGRDRMRLRG